MGRSRYGHDRQPLDQHREGLVKIGDEWGAVEDEHGRRQMGQPQEHVVLHQGVVPGDGAANRHAPDRDHDHPARHEVATRASPTICIVKSCSIRPFSWDMVRLPAPTRAPR
jgi:hypothetical protein